MIQKAVVAGLLLAIAIACAGAAPPERQALTGSWGGPHIGLTLTAEGGQVEYDCAHGTIDKPIVPDRAGRFEVPGTHTAEHGGPVHEGEEGAGRPARYQGKLAGKRMTLTVTLTDTGDDVGTFTLTRDATPRLTKCL
jgi:hypothetical protein